MNSMVATERLPTGAAAQPLQLALVVLARIAGGPVAVDQLHRDLDPLLSGQGAAGGAPASRIDRVTEALLAAGHLAREGGRITIAERGAVAVREALHLKKGTMAWPALRDGALIAAALDLANAPATRIASLAKADGLRAAIVAHRWKLKLRGKVSPAKMRHALALKALERAFGHSIATGLGEKSALSPKASRLLAGQLSGRPRDFGTDGRLIAELAAEAVGARRPSLADLRLGVLRRFLAEPAAAAPAEPIAAANGNTAPAMEAAHAVPPPPAPEAAPARPDPAGFAAAVRAAAARRAEGWAGNRRAFVCDVWAEIREAHAGWAISLIEFKAMLVEAHRAGLIALVNADLKDKRRQAELQQSAIPWKSTVWHYVRADD